MTTELDDLYRLQKKDIPRAAAVLADAFQRDPVWSAVLDGARPAQRIAAFETLVRYGLHYGEVYAPSETLEGIAGWTPGEVAEMTFWRIFRSGAIWTGPRLGFDIVQKMGPMFEPVDADRRDNMRGKSFLYLIVIGVASQYQGQGFGGKLLRALIAQSEQAGVPIYLETEAEDNVHMYEHMGFSLIKKIVLPVVDLPMWQMVREI